MKKIAPILILVLLAGLMSACGNSDPPKTNTLPDKMLDTVWQWQELIVKDPAAQYPVVDPPNYTVFFSNDGFSDVKADCNYIQGQYKASGESLDFIVGAPTFYICAPESASATYLILMGQVDSYRLEGDKLVLPFGGGKGELIFTAVGGAGSGTTSSTGNPSEPGGPPSGTTEPPSGTAGPPSGPDFPDGGNQKVVICHKAGGKNPVTIEVSEKALKAHLAHGDSEGPCE